MNDYNDYVTAINKIYDFVSRVKAGWNNPDNLANIDKLDEFKSLVAESADEFKKPAAEVIDEPPASTSPPSKKDELFFPEPEIDTLPQPTPEEKSISTDGPIEMESNFTKVNIKPTYEVPEIKLRDGVIPSSGSSKQISKLDTSSIPSLGDTIDDETDTEVLNDDFDEGVDEL